MAVILRKQEVDKNLLSDAEAEEKAKVRVIPARKKFIPVSQQKVKKKRVAAYCRVSTESDEQEVSFDSQCKFYKNKINANPEYELVDVYADRGITGTSTEKREEFNRLMQDCIAGKIDMVITKSITRFARNTLDSIMWIRKLREHGIDIFFELENLHSLSTNEMILTTLSSIAQESSQNKSESVKWGYERQFEKGKTYLSNLYGYRSMEGHYYVYEPEAKIIREIYDLYLSGMSDQKIANILMERNVPTRTGKRRWTNSSVKNILKNEKYCGDSIQGKTYNQDCLNQKRMKNVGQRKMYYVENSHKGIITKEIYKAAQVERARRNTITKVSENEQNVGGRNKRGRYSSTNALFNRIICSDCGFYYRRTVWTTRAGKKQPVWRCVNRLENGIHVCPESPTIKEELLFKEIADIVNKMLANKKEIRADLAKRAAQYVNPKDVISELKKVENKITKIDIKIKEELEQNGVLVSRGVQDEDTLKEHLDDLYRKKRKLNEEKMNLNSRLEEIRKLKEKKIKQTLDQINASVACLTQDEIAIFVKDIVVYKDYLEVSMKNGYNRKVSIEKVK